MAHLPHLPSLSCTSQLCPCPPMPPALPALQPASHTPDSSGRAPAGTHLDVVVEAADLLAILLQDLKGVVVPKVLPLQQHVRPPGLQCRHELGHQCIVGGPSHAALAQALVALVLQQGGVVGAHVKADGQDLVGRHPRGRRVQQRLALAAAAEGGSPGAR